MSNERLDVELLTIGDELGRGEIVDTNSSWLAERMTSLGAYVRWRSSVTDDPADMRDAFERATTRARLVVCSGGLGPTDDDRTVDVVSALCGVAPVTDAHHDQRMRARFAERNFRLTPNNERQVRVPEGAAVLRNPTGLAPGFRIAHGRAEIACLPGVPREMKPMFDEGLAPYVAELVGPRQKTVKRAFKLAGIGESHVDHALHGLLASVPGAEAAATLHFRISFPENIVTLVVRHDDEAAAVALLDALEVEVRRRLGDHIYGTGDDTLSIAVGRLLRARGDKLAVAESCTGGLLGQLVTAPAGASDYFVGGTISYANEVKIRELGVRPETLAAHGAVSQEVVQQMAEGARARFATAWALAISGVAGPGGGTPKSRSAPSRSGSPAGRMGMSVARSSGPATASRSAFFRRTRRSTCCIDRSLRKGRADLLGFAA